MTKNTKRKTASEAIGEACAHVEWLQNAYPDALGLGLLMEAKNRLYDAYKANQHEEDEAENASTFDSYGGWVP